MSHDDWQLRAVTAHDVDGLHRLTGKPLVYRYLYDGQAPSAPYAGAAELRPEVGSRAVELTYLLDPGHWGLATRMAWTAIHPRLLCIVDLGQSAAPR